LEALVERAAKKDRGALARIISILESGGTRAEKLLALLPSKKSFVIGVTGPPGSGKSTLIGVLIEELASRGYEVGVLAVDPSSRLTGGALLGDRVRMMSAGLRDNIYIRSLASRGSRSLSKIASSAIKALAAAGKDLVFVETVGAGQQDYDVLEVADLVILVMAAGTGDEVQSLKAGLIELADIIVVNKADKPGAEGLITGLRIAFQGRSRQPEMIVASALKNIGVKELADKIEERFSKPAKKKDPRLIKEILIERVINLIREKLESSSRLDELSEQVARGELSIEAVIEEVINRELRR